jgi:hypothetical protein
VPTHSGIRVSIQATRVNTLTINGKTSVNLYVRSTLECRLLKKCESWEEPNGEHSILVHIYKVRVIVTRTVATSLVSVRIEEDCHSHSTIEESLMQNESDLSLSSLIFV